MKKDFEPTERGAGVQKDVKISFSGTTITVDKDKVQVKQNQDTVGWGGDVQFTIKNLPGGDIVATPQGSKWVASAGPWDSVNTYKYDIAATGYTTLDPQIEIQPGP